mgnify:CR=1 FL=1
MEYTQNYKFRLPADSDIIDIGDIDENFNKCGRSDSYFAVGQSG